MQKQENVDPKEKLNPEEEQETTDSEDGVYLYNDDGTPMDTDERTYISVDDLEEEDDSDDE